MKRPENIFFSVLYLSSSTYCTTTRTPTGQKQRCSAKQALTTTKRLTNTPGLGRGKIRNYNKRHQNLLTHCKNVFPQNDKEHSKREEGVVFDVVRTMGWWSGSHLSLTKVNWTSLGERLREPDRQIFAVQSCRANTGSEMWWEELTAGKDSS